MNSDVGKFAKAAIDGDQKALDMFDSFGSAKRDKKLPKKGNFEFFVGSQNGKFEFVFSFFID